MSILTIAIAGLGGRGRYCYGRYALSCADRCKVVAAADLIAGKREEAAKTFGIAEEKLFSSAADLLAAEKCADILIVATPDENHYDTAVKALRKGYDLLLEKPIATTREECIEIAKVAKEEGRKVLVCHVLRYSPFYGKIKNIIQSGEIGELVNLTAIENVGYWHQAHSFVRGNWRNTAESSPMILAKSCHDMDIILWLMGKKVQSVNSNGGLYYFRPEKAPEGAALRCLDGCNAKENCPYDAEKIYITNTETGVESGKTGWPASVLARPGEPTAENIREALKTGPYGRCVFHCDNDVVDHQLVNIAFDGGSTASFTMTAFSDRIYRTIQIMGTLGMIEGDMRTHMLKVTVFGKETQVIDTSVESEFGGHGGGDWLLFDDLLKTVAGEDDALALTDIADSVDGHLTCFAAEESRLGEGVCLKINRE